MIDWIETLFKIFNDLGYCEKWANWIIQYITITTFSMIINGKPDNIFQHRRGIHQGDPISPYFIICAEY